MSIIKNISWHDFEAPRRYKFAIHQKVYILHEDCIKNKMEIYKNNCKLQIAIEMLSDTFALPQSKTKRKHLLNLDVVHVQSCVNEKKIIVSRQLIINASRWRYIVIKLLYDISPFEFTSWFSGK